MDGSRLTPDTSRPLSPKVLQAARSLSVDLVTAEVVAALRARGLRSILLKGPSFASWLYRDGSVRSYADVDLLIEQRDVASAHEVLTGLGFRHLFESWPYFIRGDDAVDLHCSLKGAHTEQDHLWRVLAAMTEAQQVGGLELEVLAPPARAMHVALHAAQHGPDWPTQMEDLRRALEVLQFDTWQSALELARRLEATSAFATGLRLLASGVAIAHRLNLETEAPAETLLRSTSPPHLALGFAELHAIRGLRAKLRFIAGKLFPPRAYVAIDWPRAERGRLGLLLAYCERLIWLVRNSGPGFRAWMKARREANMRRGG